jgi:hypothetical protein
LKEKVSMEDKLELVVEKAINKQHSANQLVTLKKEKEALINTKIESILETFSEA